MPYILADFDFDQNILLIYGKVVVFCWSSIFSCVDINKSGFNERAALLQMSHILDQFCNITRIIGITPPTGWDINHSLVWAGN